MRNLLLAMGATVALAACGGGTTVAPMARYDLGGAGGKGGAQQTVPLAGVEVQSASWLGGSDMHYRLSFAEPQQRRSYVESRWVAPPGELLESALRRRLSSSQGGSGCRLQVALDEFEHRFDDTRSSAAVIELRAALAAPRGGEILLRRSLMVKQVAATADARGGAGAAREAAARLGDELESWLADASRDRSLVDRCRS